MTTTKAVNGGFTKDRRNYFAKIYEVCAKFNSTNPVTDFNVTGGTAFLFGKGGRNLLVKYAQKKIIQLRKVILNML